MRKLKYIMLVTDFGFIIYWLITLFHLIPADLLFRDYTNPLLVNWNWSFLPLDLFVSATGLSSLWWYRNGNEVWRPLVIISLTLTSVSGLQAIAFWVIAQDYNMSWWISNLFLLLYPLFFIPKLVKLDSRAHVPRSEETAVVS